MDFSLSAAAKETLERLSAFVSQQVLPKEAEYFASLHGGGDFRKWRQPTVMEELKAKAKAAGAPVKADLSKLEPGQMVVVEWRGKPVFVVRRTKEALDQLTKMDAVLADPAGAVTSQQPESIKSPYRSIEPEYLVVLGVCTHLGCSPKFRPELAPADLGADWKGGFFCPCHGSRFDLSGRVYKGVPAPTNLEVPPYSFVGDKVILIGSEEGAA